MQFIGIDLHTNKFACNYRDENAPSDAKKGNRTETLELNGFGMAKFYEALTADAHVLVEATNHNFFICTINKTLCKRSYCGKYLRIKANQFGKNKYR